MKLKNHWVQIVGVMANHPLVLVEGMVQRDAVDLAAYHWDPFDQMEKGLI